MEFFIFYIITFILPLKSIQYNIAINGTNYTKVQMIGKGSHGSVYIVRDDYNNTYAIKEFHKSINYPDLSVYKLIENVSSKYLCKIHYVLYDKEPPIILMEYIKFSSPLNITQIVNNHNNDNLLVIIALINLGRDFFKNQFIHLDLNPGNILCGYSNFREVLCRIVDYDSLIVYEDYNKIKKDLILYLKKYVTERVNIHLDDKYNQYSISTIIYYGFLYEKINRNIIYEEDKYPILEDSEEFKIYLKRGILNTLTNIYKNRDYQYSNQENIENETLCIERLELIAKNYKNYK